MNELDYLGVCPLFLGVETADWSVQDFHVAAKNAKQLGVTSLIVKIADGGIVWGNNSGGWKNALQAIEQEGLNAIPYTYSYGNTYGALQAEINILIAAMQSCGIVIADMEIEYNGRSDWADIVKNQLLPVNGLFGVTTWADPSLQDWHNVLQTLNPCVNFYLPQVYSNFLAGMYHTEFGQYSRPYYPVINLGTDAGPNDILSVVQGSNSPIICVWEYQPAIGAYSSIVKQIAQLKGSVDMQIPKGWKYDSKANILTAPNNTQVTTGFCQWVLNRDWDPGNIPLMAAVGLNPVEVGNPNLGGGTVQPFRKTVLAWTPKSGVYEMWVGQEYLALYRALNTANQTIKTLQQQSTGVVSQELISSLNSILSNTDQAEQVLTAIKTAVQDAVGKLQ